MPGGHGAGCGADLTRIPESRGVFPARGHLESEHRCAPFSCRLHGCDAAWPPPGPSRPQNPVRGPAWAAASSCCPRPGRARLGARSDSGPGASPPLAFAPSKTAARSGLRQEGAKRSRQSRRRQNRGDHSSRRSGMGGRGFARAGSCLSRTSGRLRRFTWTFPPRRRGPGKLLPVRYIFWGEKSVLGEPGEEAGGTGPSLSLSPQVARPPGWPVCQAWPPPPRLCAAQR